MALRDGEPPFRLTSMPNRLLLLVPLLVLLATPPLTAADEPSPADVQKAIKAGADHLQRRFADGLHAEKWNHTAEIVMLALCHSGVNNTSEVFRAGLEAIETCKLEYTYRVSVLAMALSRINPRLHRPRLERCAQWLVDTQLAGGEWGYPGNVQGRRVEAQAFQERPPPPQGGEEEEDDEEDPQSRTAPITLKRRSTLEEFAGARGDFSNTQFALLGLQACREAGVHPPRETWQSALDYMLRMQREEGGWGYVTNGEQDGASYASLTCAGIAGVAICLDGLGKRNVKSHPAVKKALRWLAKWWDPTENAGIDRSTIVGPSRWQYYHLYSVERVGRLLRLKKIGKHDWYAEGATWLLAHQRGDGSWSDPSAEERSYLQTADTCFALLFLTLSTPQLTGR